MFTVFVYDEETANVSETLRHRSFLIANKTMLSDVAAHLQFFFLLNIWYF